MNKIEIIVDQKEQEAFNAGKEAWFSIGIKNPHNDPVLAAFWTLGFNQSAQSEQRHCDSLIKPITNENLKKIDELMTRNIEAMHDDMT